MPPFQRINDTTCQYPGGCPSSKGAPTRQEEDTRGQGPSNEGTREAAVPGIQERVPTDDCKSQSPMLTGVRHKKRRQITLGHRIQNGHRETQWRGNHKNSADATRGHLQLENDRDGDVVRPPLPDEQEESDTPEQREIRRSSTNPPNVEDTPEFRFEELSGAVKRLKKGKSPGPDLFEAETLQRLGEEYTKNS